MKYVVAVSGGVDSIALLHIMTQKTQHDIVVAHFDHGIRDDSAADARFVQAFAKLYGVPCEVTREELGKNASEELARMRRYKFLSLVAKKHEAVIMTAHHQDDLIETIAINVVRGTGWRGLAVFGNKSIERPLLGMTKDGIYEYALKHSLEWVEDSTNSEIRYARNRIRRRINTSLSDAAHNELLSLWNIQNMLRKHIDSEANSLLTGETASSRYFFINVDDDTASELLRAVLLRANASLTRPQRHRMLMAIKTARAKTSYQAGQGVEVSFTATQFIVKNTS